MTTDFVFVYAPKLIEDEISGFADRIGDAPPGNPNEAYSSGFLAEIYGPRVAELVALRADGFMYAQWGRKVGEDTNRFFGCDANAPFDSPKGA